ncbi:MAG: DUF2911 domain-containing protein [Bacteroidetes bacterium]|jgi:hypothetical protein|nr:MAG: DUF2911 domain-containing protein [Bacteroidota bacterium]
MKKIVCIVMAALSGYFVMAQSELPPVDKSPMDMSYYPINYPVLKIQDKLAEPLAARVVYSRPKKEGRTIFGGLVEYGKIWRLGANEATEIEFYRKVNIGGKKIARGRYTLYAIVNENSWTFIINKETDTWGAFKYNPDKDVVRVDIPVEKTNDALENFTMTFEKKDKSINLVVAWENVRVALPVKL